MEVDEAFDLVERAVKSGRTANAYLLVGQPGGEAGELASRILSLFFGHGVDSKSHPDIHYMEPEKKSRVIGVDAVHGLVDAVSLASLEGGWKAGVVNYADRFNQSAANAFLKTLEEPPERTIFLLLSDSPEQLLATILSRCQRIDLNDARSNGLGGEWELKVETILSRAGSGPVARAGAAGKLAAMLEEFKSIAEDEVSGEVKMEDEGPGAEVDRETEQARILSRYRAYRRRMMGTVMECMRRLMARAAVENPPPIPLSAAFANIGFVEDAVRQFDERHMSELPVLTQMMDLLKL